MSFLNKKVVTKLIKKRMTISVAESCTGGLLSSSIISVSGSSKIFLLGLITYSNNSKIKLLKIPKKIINNYGAVSKECCESMVNSLSKISKSKISLSITGIAGPKGGSLSKPVGLVYVGLKKGNKINITKYRFKKKGRKYIQKIAVKKSLSLILSSLK